MTATAILDCEKTDANAKPADHAVLTKLDAGVHLKQQITPLMLMNKKWVSSSLSFIKNTTVSDSTIKGGITYVYVS